MTNYIKLMPPHTCSKLRVALWAPRSPNQFILLVYFMIHACKQMEHDIKFFRAEEAVATAMLNLEIMKDVCAQVCNLERKKIRRNPGEGILVAIQNPSDCDVSLRKSQTGCRSHKAHRYDGNSKGI